MTDLKVFGNTYTNVKGIKATDTSDAVVTFGSGDAMSAYDDFDLQTNDVVFINYDGKPLYGYPADEFLALTQMPPNPVNEGFTSQGWNWDLAEAKEYVRENGCLCIGETCVTSDGKTRIYITLDDELNLQYDFQLILGVSVSEGVEIDWGDGTTNYAVVNSNGLNKHRYTALGDYVITITHIDGDLYLGYNGSNQTLLGTSPYHEIQGRTITKIEIGYCSGLRKGTFGNMIKLKTVNIPLSCSTLATAGNMTLLGDTYSLLGIVYPKGTTNIMQNSLSYAYNLRFISFGQGNNPNGDGPLIGSFVSSASLRMYTATELPPTNSSLGIQGLKIEKAAIGGVATVINSTIRYLKLLKKITIPSTVTAINDYGFANLNFIKEYHLRPTTPPTLANTRGFPTWDYTKIYVPYSEDHSILEAYQTATNWSTLASKMEEEPQ